MWILNFAEKIIYLLIPPLARWQKFIRYSMVGGVATIGDFTIYFSLTRSSGWFAHNYLAANVCSFIVGSITGYFLNKSWTFQQGRSFVTQQYVKYVISNTITLVILQLFFYLFVSILDIYDVIAKLLLLVISIGINFSFSHFWTFKQAVV